MHLKNSNTFLWCTDQFNFQPRKWKNKASFPLNICFIWHYLLMANLTLTIFYYCYFIFITINFTNIYLNHACIFLWIYIIFIYFILSPSPSLIPPVPISTWPLSSKKISSISPSQRGLSVPTWALLGTYPLGACEL